MITIYPGREVKKGLDNLYKKVERHLCEEENLIQVSIKKSFYREPLVPGDSTGPGLNAKHLEQTSFFSIGQMPFGSSIITQQ